MSKNYIKCSKCGKMIDSRGFSIHERFCKVTKEDQANNQQKEPEKIPKDASTKECHVCKSNKIVRLDEFVMKFPERRFNTKQLYSMGYTHVCTDCGEILK